MSTSALLPTGTLKRFSTALLLSAPTFLLPVGCGLFSPSDHGEPAGAVKQADVIEPIIPAANPSTGYLLGASSVSASGGYEYTIPFDVPLGRAGMQPHLALRYASGAGVDSMGAGWSVAGAMSMIRPCAPTFATNGHVDFPTQLCLDQQQLIELGSSGEYRTENESFAQILAQPAGASTPGSFVVRLKDGRIRTYEAVKYDGTKTRFWALSAEQDRRGNKVTYTFDHQEYWDECTAAQKQLPGLYPHCAAPYTHLAFRIAQISYTSRGDEGPRRKVVFHYAPPDPSHKQTYVRVWDPEKQSYDFMDVSGLLDKIEMHGPTDEPWSGTPELAWSYDLDYQTSLDTGRPLLSSVKKCSASGGCLLAREFQYSERSPNADDSYQVLWERTLATTVTSDQLRIFDANNDGKDDIYYWVDLLSSRIYLAPQPGDVALSIGGPGPDSTPVDLDGDGDAELIGTRTLSVDPLLWERWIYEALPSGVLNPWVKLPDTPAMWANDPYVTGYHPLYIETFPLLFGDLDGDALPDLCRARPGYTLLPNDFPNYQSIEWQWTCALNLGDGSFGPFGHTEHTTLLGDGPTYLADLDGDGRAEFHQGEELIGDPEGDGLLSVMASGTLDDFTLGDFDGDGRTDTLIDATLTVSYARHSSAFDDLSAHRPGASNVPVGAYRGDFDGDGRDDLLLVWNDANGSAHMKAITMAGHDPDRLIEVRDEDSDWRERITYSRTFAPDEGPQNGSAPFPNTRVRRGFSVVSRLLSRTGTPRDRHFAYYQPTYDRHGRGLLGFWKVIEWQPDRPALIVSVYDNNQPNDGGVYPAAFHPGLTMEIVPIIEQPSPGAPIPHPSSATARIKRTEYRYTLVNHPTGTFSIIPDPTDSWSSEEWEQQVAIDWIAWPPIDWSSLAMQMAPSVAKRREGIVGLDGYGNVVVSMEQTLPGQHPVLGAIGGTKTTTFISYDYNPQDWLISLPDVVTVKSDAPDGSTSTRKTEYDHDDWGMVESIEHEPNGSASEYQLIELSRNADGVITDMTATDGGGVERAVHVGYDDERVHLTQTWNGYGHTSTVTVHPTLSVPMTATDANGVKDQWVHDDLGRLRRVFPQAGNSRTTDYERWVEDGLVKGTIVKTSGEDGSEGEIWLDDQGRTVTLRSRDFAGQWRSAGVERDALGRAFFQERPHYAGAPPLGTSVRYDSLNRVLETTLPDSSTRTSLHGFLDAVHYDAQKNEQHVAYDFDGRVAQTVRTAMPMPWDPGSIQTSSVVYGPFGQIKTVTDPGGNQTQMFYDQRGRRYQTIEPNRGATTVHYNGHGEVEWVQTATDTVSYTRDAVGRVKHRTSVEGVATLTWDTSPNGVGKLSATQSFDGTLVGYTYDSAGRVKDATWTINGAMSPLVVSRDFNSLGQLKSIEYPDVAGLGRTKIEYTYNPYGYLQDVLDISPTVASSVLWTVKERNEDDALREAQGAAFTTTRDYDKQSGKLTEIKVTDAQTQTDLFHMMYERDPNGFVLRRTELVEDREELFHVDGHYRLKEWLLTYGQGGPGSGTQASIYAYDAVDNLEKVSVSGSAIAAYDELFTHGSSGKPHALYNRATAVDPQTFFYDARGRMMSGDGRQYTYTSFDLPRSITTAVGTTQFAYDALGSRVKKHGPGGMTLSIPGVYEGHEGPGGIRHVFVVESSDGPIAEIVYRPSDPNLRAVHYRHHDALGSVSVSATQGGPVTRRYYEPFGGHVKFDGSPAVPPAHDIRHGFTGHLHDDDLGLINMRGRIFDPSTRQFLTPDPLGRLGASPYSYVLNNPLNWVDPSGFTEEDPEGSWSRGFTSLFGSTPIAAMNMSPMLLTYAIASVAAMDFPNGNDAPNSSGCPNGTGTAPRPCAAPGEAGCEPPTGSSPEYEPELMATEPEDWTQNSYLQLEGGFVAGVFNGLVPHGAVGQQLLDAAEVLPPGTPEARRGLAIGQMVGGAISIMGGFMGGMIGAVEMTTVYGAPLGATQITVSAGMVGGGMANIVAGARGLSQSMMSSGSRSTGPQAPPSSRAGGETVKDALAGLRAGHSPRVKVVNSANELEDLFGRLSTGGTPVQGTTYPGGRFVTLPDGTSIGIRAASKSGGPTIDISLSNGTRYKVHVE